MSGLTAEQIADFWPTFLRVARNTLPYADPAVWEDIAGASVERALRSAPRYTPLTGDGTPYGWLATIARRTAVDYYRATLRHESQPTAGIGGATLDAGSERHVDVLALRDAMSQLPVHLAAYGQGRAADLGIVEAGARAGIPRATATRREREMIAALRRARQRGSRGMSVVYHVADLFAGAGGTSTGALRAISARGALAQLVAVNHWPVAVATHTANHGAAAHYCMSLESAEPEDLVPGGRLDLLVASPECVHFSRARGGKPVSDQRRSGADWVLRWLERLDVRSLLIENVKEFQSWGDVDEQGRPVSQKRGRYFIAWLKKLRALGYTVDYKVLNAADYGDATTRERFFLIARKDGRPIRWPTPTHSKLGTSDMFGTLPRWRPAREIIDWSDLGPSLFERAKPLSLKTRLRIARGLQRFGGVLAPLYIRLLDLPTEDEQRFVAGCTGSIAEAFIAVGTENAVPKGMDEPLGTITTIPAIYVATPTAEPFTFGNRNNAVPVAADQPIPTATTATGGGIYFVAPEAVPMVMGQQSDAAARPVDEPIPTVATAGVVRVFTPTAQPFVDVYYQTGVADSVDEPLSTATTKQRHALVSPVATFISPFYSGAPTKSERAHSVDEPIRTIPTENRFGLASAFLTPGFGEADGQQPRVHSLEDALPTVAAQGHMHLASATLEAGALSVDPRRLVVADGQLLVLDIRFRMLKNSELAAAMGFPADYQFTGTKTDVTRQIGNAVCVNLATALVGAILDDGAAVTEVAS